MNTYYCTKYALTHGIKAVDLNDDQVSKGEAYFRDGPFAWTYLTIGKHLFSDPSMAEADLVNQAKKKIASLEKQIAKLRLISTGDFAPILPR